MSLDNILKKTKIKLDIDKVGASYIPEQEVNSVFDYSYNLRS